MMDEDKNAFVLEQVLKEKLSNMHRFCMEDANSTIKLIKESGMKITTMGREAEQDKEFFMALGASAITAARLVKVMEPHYIMLA
jgi:hypothetical protein